MRARVRSTFTVSVSRSARSAGREASMAATNLSWSGGSTTVSRGGPTSATDAVRAVAMTAARSWSTVGAGTSPSS
jgi:hypothetical protein